MRAIFHSMRLMIKSKKHLAIVIFSTIFMFFLAVLIPAITIPSNTLEYQLSLFTWDSVLLTIIFSLLFGISMGMHSYASKMSKLRKGAVVGERAGTGFFSFIGTLFAGKLCPMCLSAIFGFLGLGASAVFFVLSFTVPILFASMLLILISIYFAGKRIANACENCKG